MKSQSLILFSLVFSLSLLVTGCGSASDDVSQGGTPGSASVIDADGEGQFSTDKYMSATGKDHDALLGKEAHTVYFYATWCSTCNRVKNAVKENIASFPIGTKILELSFDDEEELKKRYDVVHQTTFLVFDAQGKLLDTLLVPSVNKLKDAIAASL